MNTKEFPKNWYIEITDDNKKLVNDWKVKQPWNSNLFIYSAFKYVDNNGVGSRGFLKNKIKITTEQFIEHVLKTKIKNKKIVVENHFHLIKLIKQL